MKNIFFMVLLGLMVSTTGWGMMPEDWGTDDNSSTDSEPVVNSIRFLRGNEPEQPLESSSKTKKVRELQPLSQPIFWPNQIITTILGYQNDFYTLSLLSKEWAGCASSLISTIQTRHGAEINDTHIKSLTRLNNLKTLILPMCRISDDLNSLSFLATLKNFEVYGHSKGNTSFAWVFSLSNLEHLVLSVEINESDIAQISKLTKLHTLRYKPLGGCGKPVNLSGLTNLHTLVLPKCYSSTFQSLLHLSGLTSLDLSDSDHYEIGKLLSQKLTNLRYLNLSWGPVITDEDCRFFASLPKLDSLNLNWVEQLGKKGISYLLESPSLKVVRVDSRFPKSILEELQLKKKKKDRKNSKLLRKKRK